MARAMTGNRSTPTRVVVALDSFKGSISALEASTAFGEGWKSVQPDARILVLPVADGGEGTLAAFESSHEGAQRKKVWVTGPDGRRHEAEWLLLPATESAPAGTGIVELASTSGIELLGEERMPWHSHTVGLGQAIAAALDHGVSKLIVGLGSSASTDAGVGLLSALGARFTDRSGSAVPFGAEGLTQIYRVDLSNLRQLPPGGVVALVDVANPLLGAQGAAAVFGPQKGFSKDEIAVVEQGLQHVAGFFDRETHVAGDGAAGGAGYAMRLWGAQLVPGAAVIAESLQLRERIMHGSGFASNRASDMGEVDGVGDVKTVVITGEGSFDAQSSAGKAPYAVAQIAKSCGAQVGLVAGRIEVSSPELFNYQVSLSSLAGSSLAGSAEAAMANPARWLREAGAAMAAQASH